MNLRALWPLVLSAGGPCALMADDRPPYQSDSPPEEFRARRNAVFDRIGERAVAIVAGAPRVGGFLVPRQTNEFDHLCGIETPHAYLVLVGRDRKATPFLRPRDARLESAEGKVISAEDAGLVKELPGVDAVASTGELAGDGLRHFVRGPGATVYTPFAPGERDTPGNEARRP